MFVTFAYFVFLHRKLLSFIMVPVVQRELDTFKEMVWNSHRIRAQKDTVLPDGVPNHIYSFPQKYGLEECGKKIIRFCQNWFWEFLLGNLPPKKKTKKKKKLAGLYIVIETTYTPRCLLPLLILFSYIGSFFLLLWFLWFRES